ncbi:MAG: hypothetical protein IPO18_08185 [bacterium]|nr:hypothetical protein [bacterium]MBK9472251.1 hypothetical protein [bacterium]
MTDFLKGEVALAMPVLATAVIAFLVEIIAHRYTVIPRSANRGFFLLILPVVVGLFGLKMPPAMSVVSTMAGLGWILWCQRRSRFAAADDNVAPAEEA